MATKQARSTETLTLGALPPTALAKATPLDERFMQIGEKQFTFKKRTKLEPGLAKMGIFLGFGGYVWVEDPADASKENEVPLWNIQTNPQLVEQIAGSSQLNNELPYYPIGDDICIMLGASKGTSKRGRQFSDHLISDPSSGRLAEPTVVIPQRARKRDKASE